MKRSVTVEIASNQYKLTSDGDEAHLHHLAEMINARIAALGPGAARTVSPSHLLALVAMGLAEELHSTQQGKQELEQITRSTIAQAIARIDARLEADAALARQLDASN